jgi:hypothetical protein
VRITRPQLAMLHRIAVNESTGITSRPGWLNAHVIDALVRRKLVCTPYTDKGTEVRLTDLGRTILATRGGDVDAPSRTRAAKVVAWRTAAQMRGYRALLVAAVRAGEVGDGAHATLDLTTARGLLDIVDQAITHVSPEGRNT